MKIWVETETDECPWCGEPETSFCVLACWDLDALQYLMHLWKNWGMNGQGQDRQCNWQGGEDGTPTVKTGNRGTTG